jgi:hypothetical protein
MKLLAVCTFTIAMLSGASTVFAEIVPNGDSGYREDGNTARPDQGDHDCDMDAWAIDTYESSWIEAWGWNNLRTTTEDYFDWSYSIWLLADCVVGRVDYNTPYAYCNIFGQALCLPASVNVPRYSWALIDESYEPESWGDVEYPANPGYASDSGTDWFNADDEICVEYDAVIQTSITQGSDDDAYGWMEAHLDCTLAPAD